MAKKRQMTEKWLAALERARAAKKKNTLPIAERIKRFSEPDANGCWIWSGRIVRSSGYGNLPLHESGRVRYALAHRLSYETFVGPIPDGLQIDHLCRVRHCVNPDHLEPVTARENQLRSPISLGSLNLAKTHCPQGHPYDEGNTYRHGPGGRWRQCKTCVAARSRARHLRDRGAVSA